MIFSEIRLNNWSADVSHSASISKQTTHFMNYIQGNNVYQHTTMRTSKQGFKNEVNTYDLSISFRTHVYIYNII